MIEALSFIAIWALLTIGLTSLIDFIIGVNKYLRDPEYFEKTTRWEIERKWKKGISNSLKVEPFKGWGKLEKDFVGKKRKLDKLSKKQARREYRRWLLFPRSTFSMAVPEEVRMSSLSSALKEEVINTYRKELIRKFSKGIVSVSENSLHLGQSDTLHIYWNGDSKEINKEDLRSGNIDLRYFRNITIQMYLEELRISYVKNRWRKIK